MQWTQEFAYSSFRSRSFGPWAAILDHPQRALVVVFLVHAISPPYMVSPGKILKGRQRCSRKGHRSEDAVERLPHPPSGPALEHWPIKAICQPLRAGNLRSPRLCGCRVQLPSPERDSNRCNYTSLYRCHRFQKIIDSVLTQGYHHPGRSLTSLLSLQLCGHFSFESIRFLEQMKLIYC